MNGSIASPAKYLRLIQGEEYLKGASLR